MLSGRREYLPVWTNCLTAGWKAFFVLGLLSLLPILMLLVQRSQKEAHECVLRLGFKACAHCCCASRIRTRRVPTIVAWILVAWLLLFGIGAATFGVSASPLMSYTTVLYGVTGLARMPLLVGLFAALAVAASAPSESTRSLACVLSALTGAATQTKATCATLRSLVRERLLPRVCADSSCAVQSA